MAGLAIDLIEKPELLKEAKLDGKSIYVIPNGATVVPHVC